MVWAVTPREGDAQVCEAAVTLTLSRGDSGISIPLFLQGRPCHDLREPATFEQHYRSLLQALYGIGGRPPEVGEAPQDLEQPPVEPLRGPVDAPGIEAPLIEGPRFRSEEAAELSSRLKALYELKREGHRKGTSVEELEQEILDLRRRLRQGPLLQQGEFLREGRYELSDLLGQGGFATVWNAWDSQCQELVALKVLHGHHSEDRTKRERFFRGARKMAELARPSIVGVRESQVVDSGWNFYAMEYLRGGTLEEAVLERRLRLVETLTGVLDVGEALAYAHWKGVIHRDVKPANIIVDAEGRAKLSDFDLVRADDTTGLTHTQAMA